MAIIVIMVTIMRSHRLEVVSLAPLDQLQLHGASNRSSTEACPWEQASVSIPHFVNLVLLVAVLGKVTLMGKAVSITLVSSSSVNKPVQIQNFSDQAEARVIL